MSVRVHVSIHDVAPPFQREIELALDMARERGARPAVLVVPNYHGEAPLDRAPSFCSFLRGLQAQGHEVFLHGFFHEKKVSRWTLGSYLAQRVVSAGEAEMSDLTRDETVARLDAGERALARAGLTVDGFVPPAWWSTSWLLPILAARGYRYSEDHLRIHSPARARSRASLVLNFASRTPWRLLSSVAFCRVATPLASVAPTRIAIHPADMRFAALRREVSRLLAWGSAHFVTRASELFD
jgi:predicted deacetylase